MSLADLAASKILSQDASQCAFSFEQPGVYNVTLPKHVSIVWVDGAGGGGGGGGGLTGGGAGAGGGASVACRMFPIYVPANCRKLTITVGDAGAGGAGGAAPTVGTAGTASSILLVASAEALNHTILNLPGGFSAGANPTTTLGGAPGYANGTWMFAPPAAATSGAAGNVGVPQPWTTSLLGISTTGSMWSGSTGGGGGSWSGTGVGGNGGNGGAAFINSGWTPGGTGGTLGAGGGGGGTTWGGMFSYGGFGQGGNPGVVAVAPMVYGQGGNGGGTGQAGTAGSTGFMRLYW